MKKIFKVFTVFLLLTFSFFYTDKICKIMRKKDPIMIKINKLKDEKYINAVKPIVNNDEYILGINGCEIDVEKSYEKMKTVKEYKKELLVMKEVKNEYDLDDKYIVSANKINKNISIIFLLKDELNQELIDLINNKKISVNYFVSLNYLENNIIDIKLLSENNNIYYYGENGKYDSKYIKYANNIININSNNISNLCLTENKNNELLKICSNNNMKTIKTYFIKDNIINNVKEKLSNGSIIVIDSNDINKIKVSINYILSKGYNIVSLSDLFNENKNCNN